MPSKPAKYGIKSWVACDANSSYAWKMQVYNGKPTSGVPEKNQGMWVDRVNETYSCRRKTDSWPLVIFHIIDVSSYNAFVIWREVNPTWMPRKHNKRRVFLEQLEKALVTRYIERREHLPRPKASAVVVKAVQRARSQDRPVTSDFRDYKS